jgi:hypothetical protein
MEDELWAVAGGTFIEFASQGGQCSSAHEAYLRDKGASVLWLSDILVASPLNAEEFSLWCGRVVAAAEYLCVLLCFNVPINCRITPPLHPDVWSCVSLCASPALRIPALSGLPASKALTLAGTSRAAAALLRVITSKPTATVFVSFDIDSISGADCPGVSCPATVGLTAFDAVSICFIAGLHPRVKLVDVSELNPVVEDYRSPRLVVNMFYYFLMGLSQRRAT